jgi:AcrR family transcriptional regulator
MQRTRAAILDAARGLIEAGAEVSMPLVAKTALVSEATAYRYFPDLVLLLSEAFRHLWGDPVEAMHPSRGYPTRSSEWPRPPPSCYPRSPHTKAPSGS